ncbi:LEO1 [Candida pseudojiufengensis]|uniref:LEO1 n=1 Tax=Candida pseudojiufengensis TaxID=497109 RepID=UPI00222506BF|nr:LEO1 [Candida pseudojiufengensis]KAI5960856.1 LEO1 [Candida pseudojiufengensis]
MSEPENESELKEELDDLFGDEDGGEQEEIVEEDEDNDDEQSETERTQQSQSQSIRNNTYLSQSEEEEEEYPEETQKKILDISLPRHAISSISEQTQILKTPMNLKISPHPFDPIEFKNEIEENQEKRILKKLNSKQIYNERIIEKLINETTIRWRYHNSGNDEIIKQSNSHFIQWDDGSISLKIGEEMFDVKTLPIADNYLVNSLENFEILQSNSQINQIINLFPSSNNSLHKKLLQNLKNIHSKDKILNTITEDDPLKQQRLADENEKRKLKMKKQLEAKRRIEEEKWERGESPSLKESSYKRFSRTYGDDDDDDDVGGAGLGEGYDEEDDFVAGDEEEVEEFDDDNEDEEEEGEEVEDDEENLKANAERLKKLKDEGAAKYREKSSTVEPETETRKRKRIIESDDEDE